MVSFNFLTMQELKKICELSGNSFKKKTNNVIFIQHAVEL